MPARRLGADGCRGVQPGTSVFALGLLEGFLDLSVYALPNLNSGTALLSRGHLGLYGVLQAWGAQGSRGLQGRWTILFKALKEAQSSIGKELFSTYRCPAVDRGGQVRSFLNL